MSAGDGGQARSGSGYRRPGGPYSCAQGTGPVHRRIAAARRAAAPRAAPDRRGAELRQPADGEDRRNDGRRPLGQPQHDVPPPAPARVQGAHRGPVGASGAAFAAVLLADGRGQGGIRAPGGGGPALPGLGEVVDRRDRAGGLRAVRRASARAALPLPPVEVLRLWSDIDRWPTFVQGFARRLGRTQAWHDPGRRVVWESTPDGRGRVTETVAENAPDRFATQVYEKALTGTQTLRALPASDGSEVELSLEYELTRYGPLRGVADAIFIRR